MLEVFLDSSPRLAVSLRELLVGLLVERVILIGWVDPRTIPRNCICQLIR